jgi:hypothetical protein
LHFIGGGKEKLRSLNPHSQPPAKTQTEHIQNTSMLTEFGDFQESMMIKDEIKRLHSFSLLISNSTLMSRINEWIYNFNASVSVVI